MNFPLILVIATFVCGLIWLLDRLFFAARRRARLADEGAPDPLLVEYARSFFPVLLVVLVLRSFLFEPFRIPSGSMIPTLLVGDFILVNKFSYGVRLPVVHTKLFDTGAPERGDVAVFRFPDDPSQDYIKRVIGLPGDVVEYRDKTFSVNGNELEIIGGEPYVPPGSVDPMLGAMLSQERIDDELHDILRIGSTASESRTWTVPDGEYFMVGDNRDRSDDGRRWGFVPEANLVGRATYVWMHWSGELLWSRLGTRIE